jgi:DNA polymerase-1
MPTLYLIDGNSYMYRAFYAIKRLSNSKGFPTNAIYGFTNMILKVMREKKPDYFGVVFDSPVPTERHKAYADYKAHRPKMPDDLSVQVQPIKDIINAFRIPNVEVEGYEADDVLATLAKKAEKKRVDVFIITADKDINQVLSPRIKTYDTMRDKITESRDVIERFGVEPSRFPEIMALMGDVSDNIPGVSGVGEKTAVSLLKEFGTLDALMKNHSRIKKPKLRQAISENLENIRLSLQLAVINTHVPVKVSVDELKLNEPDWATLSDMFRTYEFQSLLKLIPEQAPLPHKDETKYTTVFDLKVLKSAIASIGGAGLPPSMEIAIDTETTSRSPITAELVGISLSIDPDEAFYIPLTHMYEGVPEQLSKRSVISALRDVLEDHDIKKIGHNIKYDMIVLRNEGIKLSGIGFDTMLASYLLNPNKTNHSLEDVSLAILRLKKLSFREVTENKKKSFREVPVDIATQYSGEDSAVSLKLKRILEPEIEKQKLEKLLYTIEIPLISVLAYMEMAGIRIDLPLMKSLSKELEEKLAGLEKRIYFLAGEEFNINSPKQLQEILFEKLGLKPIRKTKTGFSTDVGVLEQLSLTHELPKEILDHRTLSKLKNTYLDALPKIVNPETGRIHTSFNQTVTATGRLSSSDPNLQNIPVRGEWGKRIRETFVAEKGHLLLSSDYSQVELRILAHLSRDRGLIDVFRKNGDIHTRTACELFGVTPENTSVEMRRRAKTVNFGILYGISPYGLSRELGISTEEAKRYIETYFAKHTTVKKYIDSLVKKATEEGFVSTIFGRKRAIPELQSSNKNMRMLGERLAVNTPIQGSAADIIKISMINIHDRIRKEGLKARILLQVHDELLVETPVKEKSRVKTIVKKEMESVLELRVPLKVDIGVGKNWAEAH